MSNLIGSGNNQAPANGDLGPLAYMRNGTLPRSIFEADVLAASSLPDVRPSINFDFAGAESVDSRIIFSRTTSASIIGRSGYVESVGANAPRIDFDPITRQCKGLLIEEAKTNIFTYSEQLDNAAWSRVASSVSPNFVDAVPVLSPAGRLDADLLIEDNTLSKHQLFRSNTFNANEITTISVFARRGARNGITLNTGDGNAYASFNLLTGEINGTFASGTVNNVSAAMEAYPNGWYRCSLSMAYLATAAAVSVRISLLQNPTLVAANESYLGDGTSGVYLWGAQLEVGEYASSYIPTVASQVTRASDNAVYKPEIAAVPPLGVTLLTTVLNNFNNSGSLFRYWADYSNAAGSIRLVTLAGATDLQSSTFGFGANLSSSTGKVFGELTQVVSGGNSSLAKNANYPAVVGARGLPNVLPTALHIGRRFNSVQYANAHIKLVQVYDSAVTEKQAIALTEQ